METIAPMQTVQSMQSNNVLQVRTAPNNNALIRSTLSPRRTTESTSTLKRSPFIEANTVAVTLDDLRSDFIPVFAKDNESTIHTRLYRSGTRSHFSYFPVNPYPMSSIEYHINMWRSFCCFQSLLIFRRLRKHITLRGWHFLLKSLVTDTINGNELVLSIVGVRAIPHNCMRKGSKPLSCDRF
jgi:hypothetical protein